MLTSGGVDAGTYTVSGDGTVTITLNSDFDTSKGFDGYITLEGFVHDTNSSGSDTYTIGGKTTITVNPKTQEENHDVSLQKSGSQDENDKNIYHYTVVASSTNGSGRTYRFDDRITDIYPDHIRVSKATVYDNNGNVLGTYDFFPQQRFQ